MTSRPDEGLGPYQTDPHDPLTFGESQEGPWVVLDMFAAERVQS